LATLTVIAILKRGHHDPTNHRPGERIRLPNPLCAARRGADTGRLE